MKKRITRKVGRYEVHWELKPINGKTLILLDLSPLGSKLETSEPMRVRDTVDLSILIPGLKTEMQLAGQVVWIRQLITNPGRYHIGLKFHVPCWELEEGMRNIASNWEAQGCQICLTPRTPEI